MTHEVPRLDAAGAIAVLRANGMGDYLASEPAMAALRAAAPRARITLLGAAWHAEALARRPGPVDEVVVLPHLPGEVPDDTAQFYRDMRARRFDVAVQMHGGGRNSNPMVSALGAGFTAGLRAEDAPPLDATLAYQYWQPEVLRCLEVVELLGVPPVRIRPEFPVLAADLAAADDALETAGIDSGRPLVVLHPGATDPQRRWPAERFAQVADVLLAQGVRVAVIGTAQEQAVVDEVVGVAREAVPLPGLSFSALVGVLARAVLLVGNDSGPRHLADAVGTATVSIYWFGNVINAGPLGRDRHRVHISWTTQCPQCGRSCVGEPFPTRCYDGISFVRDVRTQSVTRSAVDLLRQEGAHGGQRDVGGRRHEFGRVEAGRR